VAAWVKCVLAEGFGLDLVDQAVDSEHELSFRPYNGPEDAELTWTLGKMVQVITGNTKIEKLRLDQIVTKHNKIQRDVMEEKAARCQELAVDYLSILCSLPDVDNKDAARAKRLEESARAALATSWSMLQAGGDLRHKAPKGARLLNPKEQLVVVRRLWMEISREVKEAGEDAVIDMEGKFAQAIWDLGNWAEVMKEAAAEGTVTE
jgi:hypothetical protein